MPRRGECSAAQLFGIQAVRHALWRIAALRQGARQRFGGEFIAESGLVGERHGDSLQHAAAHLVALDGLEQGLEVAFAETLVALALDDLEENRTDRVLGEDLQQLSLFDTGKYNLLRIEQLCFSHFYAWCPCMKIKYLQ